MILLGGKKLYRLYYKIVTIQDACEILSVWGLAILDIWERPDAGKMWYTTVVNGREKLKMEASRREILMF